MKIALLGDTALFGSFDLLTNPYLKKSLVPVANYLNQFDHVVANLEAPFSFKKKVHGAKSAYLYTNPENIEVLKMLNIDIVNLANNHIFDYGNEGYEVTKTVLEQYDINWFGCEGKIVEVKEKNNDIVFDGYCCYSTNPLKLVHYGAYGVNRLDFEFVCQKLYEYKNNNQLPILAIHSGLEHVPTPDIDNIIMSRKWAEITSYIYYGHHPHVIQGLEMYNDSLIAHSLGNFMFDDLRNLVLSEENRLGLILEIEIEENVIRYFNYKKFGIGKGEIRIDHTPITQYQHDKIIFENGITDPLKYTKERINIRNKWIEERKNKRTLQWYLKRLTPRYAELWWTNHQNAKKYLNHVKQKLY